MNGILCKKKLADIQKKQEWENSLNLWLRCHPAAQIRNAMRCQRRACGSHLHGIGIPPKPSVRCRGSGYVIIYHIGVGRYIQGHCNLDNVTFLAALGRSIVAAMLALVHWDQTCKQSFPRIVATRQFSRQLPFEPSRVLDGVAKAFGDLMTNMSDKQIRETTR